MKPAPKGAGGLLSQDLQHPAAGSACTLLGKAVHSLSSPGFVPAHALPRYCIGIIAGLTLSACSSQPIVRVQYVTVKSYIPIPATLTASIAIDLTGQTYGEGLGSLRAALERCDGQLAAIRVLTPPSPPHK